MPRVSAMFFSLGAIVLMSGMIWGSYMGATQDHSLFPAHAHMNLLAGILNLLYGTFYALAAANASTRIAWANLIVANLGAALFIPALIPTLQGNLQYLAVEVAGEVLTLLGMVIFVISTLRELFRARS